MSYENQIQLKIRFRKNLAKLKGSAVRIKSKKPNGKKTMKEKKKRRLPRGDLNAHSNFLQRKQCGLQGPRGRHIHFLRKLISLKYLSLPSTLFEPYGAVFIMNIQRYIWGKIAQTSIQNHFALSPCLFTLGLYVGRSINGLVFFFAAFAEVQVTVLSVLNLPRQGFPASCPVGHCCVCNPWLFASEIILRFANVQ